MSFSYITLAQARTQLANRLGDPAAATSDSYWSPDELNAYLEESLRVWNCAANYFVNVGVFTTSLGQAWYDLASEFPTLVGNTTTDTDVVTQMEYQLLEPPTPTVWTGTEMFTLDDLTQALQRRRNQFLEDTGIFIDLPVEIPTTPADSGIVQFSQNVLQQRRVAWKSAPTSGTGNMLNGSTTLSNLSFTATESSVGKVVTVAGAGIAGATLESRVASFTSASEVELADTAHDTVTQVLVTLDGNYTQLPRTDLFAINAQVPGWNTAPSTPEFYMPYYATSQTRLQLAPVPIDLGSVELLSVNAGAELDPATGVVIGFDDDFIPFIRYGALADLLNMEGMANDPQRASYCEQRYREGVELAKNTFTIIQAKINGVPVPNMSLDDFDFQISDWQNVSGQPTDLASGNSNLTALYPVPDGVYSVECNLIVNAIIPANDGEYLQVDKSVLDAILSYAVHVACFKLGGQEFSQSLSLLEQFYREAAIFNSKLAANQKFFDILGQSGSRETSLRPAIAA